MRLGKLIYKYIFQPTSAIRYNLHHFGLLGWYKMYTGEQQMKKAAITLTPVKLLNNYILEVSYLTGAKYWHQTVFCAHSLAYILQGQVKVNIYSDGTLSAIHRKVLNSVLPGINLINPVQIHKNLEQFLPECDFPKLRSLRDTNPFFRKLIDMRLNDKYIIQLDSDMLFFNTPHELIKAYNTGNYYFMQDKIKSSFYVLPENTISKYLNIPIKEKINSGILAYNSADIDWIFVEKTCSYLLQHTSSIHPPMFEQTLNAIIISQLKGNALNQYYNILYDGENNQLDDIDIVRHYIFKAKLPYFTKEWKKAIR